MKVKGLFLAYYFGKSENKNAVDSLKGLGTLETI